MQLRHDLKQYVAAGMLLTEQPPGHNGVPEERQRLQRLRDLFFGMTKLTDPPPVVARRPLDLVAVVEECVSVARIVHRVELQVTHSGPIKAVGDPALLGRAVANVLDNAIRASGPTGHVQVRLYRAGPDAVVEVVDDGAGFGAIPSVSGHGMAIVDRALRTCHGHLEIVSGPGPGTTVRMLVPARQPGGDVA